MLIFRQLFDAASSTYTYLLGDSLSGEGMLIDPVFEQVPRDAALLRELGLQLTWTLDTHVHADHVTGAALLRQRLGSRVAVAAVAGASGADRGLQHGDRVDFGARHVEVRATPGHTNGCLSYVLDDFSRAFTGDCLLIRGCGRTDFQQGDSHQMYGSVHRHLFTLPGSCLLYPAHDYNGLTVTSVDEERRFNPRLGGEVIEDDFAGFMRNLNLPHPKQIDVAVPANLRCGEPADGLVARPEPTWGPLRLAFSGLWEIEPRALDELRAAGHGSSNSNSGHNSPTVPAVQVLDVREPDEFNGALGHIPGAQLMPLAEVAARCDELDRSRPLVVVCRSGARSARAVAILSKAGFADVANLAGGMLRWRVDGGAVSGGQV